MKYAVLLLLTLAFQTGAPTARAASGTIYKCVRNGQIAFQDHPCATSSQQIVVGHVHSANLVGCYRLNTSPSGAAHTQDEVLVIVRTDHGYGLESPHAAHESHSTVPMRRSTPEDMEAVASAFPVKVLDGVTVYAPDSDLGQRHLGLYKIRTRDGKQRYFAYLFFANAMAKRIPCTAQ